MCVCRVIPWLLAHKIESTECVQMYYGKRLDLPFSPQAMDKIKRKTCLSSFGRLIILRGGQLEIQLHCLKVTSQCGRVRPIIPILQFLGNN